MSTTSEEQYLRQQVVDTARLLASGGLSVGKSGNVSVRFNSGMLITPSAVEYDKLSLEDIVYMENGVEEVAAKFAPSSEWRFHEAILQSRQDVNAVIHAHATYCTALACVGRAIPAFHYMVAIAGGDDIPLADYALYGTDELSDYVVDVLRGRNACLMANHGMLAISHDLHSAFNLAIEIENLAKQYSVALKLGEPKLLSDKQMIEVIEKFKHYGQRV